MSEEIKIYFDEDGIAKEYDDTYDITIHCESEEEQNKLLDRLNRHWIPVSERLPEKNDVYLVAINSYGCPTRDVDGFVSQSVRKWEMYGKSVVAWMPLPEPYKASPTGAERSDEE